MKIVKRNSFMLVLCLVVVWTALFRAEWVQASDLVIAAASELQYALDATIPLFRMKHPEIKLKLVYGSSENFHSQLKQKAPFDLFFSDDPIYTQDLIKNGFIFENLEFRYGIGKIVLWALKTNSFPLEQYGLKICLDPSVKKIVVANPQHSAYGKVAIGLLKSYRIYDSIKSKLVSGDSVSQAAQFMQSGAAQVGVIALGLAAGAPLQKSGKFMSIPLDTYSPIFHTGVILQSSSHLIEAKAFRDFILSSEGKVILKKFGF